MYFTRHSIAVLLWSFFAAGTAGAQITLVDDLGRTVLLDNAAQRVVSLAPSITESLFAIGAGKQVVGVTEYCNYPSEARTKRSVGGMVNPNIEQIVALLPDLVVMSMEGNVLDDYTRLNDLGIPVLVSNPRTIDGICLSLRTLGAATGHQREAESLAVAVHEYAMAIRAKTAQPRVRTLFIISTQPLIVVGTRTFLNELLEMAGGTNVAASVSGTYPAYSREALAVADPDVILIMSEAAPDIRSLPNIFPEWKSLRAVRSNRVVSIDADIVSRPGPRAIDGLEAIYSALHGAHP